MSGTVSEKVLGLQEAEAYIQRMGGKAKAKVVKPALVLLEVMGLKNNVGSEVAEEVSRLKNGITADQGRVEVNEQTVESLARENASLRERVSQYENRIAGLEKVAEVFSS